MTIYKVWYSEYSTADIVKEFSITVDADDEMEATGKAYEILAERELVTGYQIEEVTVAQEEVMV